jgi:hypothetical protein
MRCSTRSCRVEHNSSLKSYPPRLYLPANPCRVNKKTDFYSKVIHNLPLHIVIAAQFSNLLSVMTFHHDFTSSDTRKALPNIGEYNPA